VTVRSALLVLALALPGGTTAQTVPQGAPAAGPVASPSAAHPVKPAAKAAKKGPAWAELTAEHQQVLAPLKADWESLEPDRKRKWIGIAKRYPSMKLQEQERVQRRMQAWVKLTPEQRRQARENYREISKVRADKRKDLHQQWAEYQALSPYERQNLAPAAQPEPQSKKKSR
jgi:hypothetical protein